MCVQINCLRRAHIRKANRPGDQREAGIVRHREGDVPRAHERVRSVLKVEHVGPHQVKFSIGHLLLDRQLGFRLQTDSDLSLVVEGSIDTAVAQIDPHTRCASLSVSVPNDRTRTGSGRQSSAVPTARCSEVRTLLRSRAPRIRFVSGLLPQFPAPLVLVLLPRMRLPVRLAQICHVQPHAEARRGHLHFGLCTVSRYARLQRRRPGAAPEAGERVSVARGQQALYTTRHVRGRTGDGA